MNHKLAPQLIAAVVAMTSLVSANDGFRVGSSGVSVRMTSRDSATSSTTAAVSDWSVRTNVNQVVLHWNITPFVHLDDDAIQSDAMIAATVTNSLGPLQISPSRVSDRTNLSGGDREASVAMGLRRNGKANIQLRVGIDDRHAVAGRHHADVTLTLTSH